MINVIFVCVLAGAATLKPCFDEKCSTLMIDSMYIIIDMRDSILHLYGTFFSRTTLKKQRSLRSY